MQKNEGWEAINPLQFLDVWSLPHSVQHSSRELQRNMSAVLGGQESSSEALSGCKVFC